MLNYGFKTSGDPTHRKKGDEAIIDIDPEIKKQNQLILSYHQMGLVQALFKEAIVGCGVRHEVMKRANGEEEVEIDAGHIIETSMTIQNILLNEFAVD